MERVAHLQLGTSSINQSSPNDSDEQFAELLIALDDAAFGDGWKVQLLVQLRS